MWRLSTGNSFHTVSKTFVIGKSTAVTITREFYTEIFRLSGQFIKFPISQLKTAKTIENFKQVCDCKIPQALGAVVGNHIFIQTPENERKHDYYCHKQRYSINTHVVGGASSLFLDVATGFPGSMRDSQVLRYSSLFRRVEQNETLKNPKDITDNLTVRPLLLGDGEYLLCKWLMKPYSFTPTLNNIEKVQQEAFIFSCNC